MKWWLCSECGDTVPLDGHSQCSCPPFNGVIEPGSRKAYGVTQEELAFAASLPGAHAHRCVGCNDLSFVWHSEWSRGSYTCSKECSLLVWEMSEDEDEPYEKLKVYRNMYNPNSFHIQAWSMNQDGEDQFTSISLSRDEVDLMAQAIAATPVQGGFQRDNPQSTPTDQPAEGGGG